MSNIKNWRVTASDNTSAAPMGAPEGWAPSAVNNTIRQQMADHRTQWQEAPWFDWGHVLTRTGNQAFNVSISNTVGSTIYTAGRRLKLIDGGVTIAGEVLATSASGSNTLVSVSSSNLSASLSSGSISIFDPAVPSWPLASWADMVGDSVSASFNSGKLVTPAALKHYVGAAKAWGYVSYSTTGSNVTLLNSWNVLSVTSTSTGIVTVTYQVTISASLGQYLIVVGNAFGPEGVPGNLGDRRSMIDTYQRALAALTVLDEPTPVQRYYALRMRKDLAAVWLEEGNDWSRRSRCTSSVPKPSTRTEWHGQRAGRTLLGSHSVEEGNMSTAVICSALLGLLVFLLGFNVSRVRAKTKVGGGFGAGSADPLTIAVRAHGNTYGIRAHARRAHAVPRYDGAGGVGALDDGDHDRLSIGARGRPLRIAVARPITPAAFHIPQ